MRSGRNLRTSHGVFGLVPLALAGTPATPSASLSDFVDDHLGLLVAAVLGAILILLGIVMVMQSGNGDEQAGIPASQPPPGQAPPAAVPPG